MTKRTKDIDPDTPAYAKQFVTPWMKRMKPGKQKQFVTKYIAYIEGRALRPNYYEYGLTEKQWNAIWKKLSAYSHRMGRSTPEFGVIPW